MMRAGARHEEWTGQDAAGEESRYARLRATALSTSIPSSPAAAPTRGRSAPRMRRHGRLGPLAPVLSLLLFAGLIYAVWEAVCLAGVWPPFILPTPLQVAQDFATELASGDLLANAGVTVQEALSGFALAAIIAGVVGYVIARSRLLEVLVAPFIATSQAIPVVAVAPIIILLFGVGLSAKIVICAVIVVFPLLITTITGLRGVERAYHDVARVYGASRLQTLLLVELPLAAPTLLSGLKLGLTLSIVGAVVGEFVSANSGLGFMIAVTSAGSFDAATRYVALLALVILSVTLFGLVTLLERILLRWRDD